MKLIKRTYSDPTQDAHIGNLERELIGYSEIQGRQNAINNKPMTEPELRAYYMNFTESKVQSAIDQNQQIHLPVSGMAVAHKCLSEAKQSTRPLKASLAEDEHKLRPLEEQKKQLAPDLQKRRLRRLVYIACVIIAIAEAYFAYEAFRTAVIPTIPAFFASLGIGVAIGFGAHFLGEYVAKAKTRVQKILRYSIALLPAFIGFYILGHLRAEGYNHVVNLNPGNEIPVPETGGVSGWSLTIISFLLYTIALLFSIKSSKTKQERNQDKEYDRICTEIKKLLNKMQTTCNTIEGIEREANEKAVEALACFEYALATEKRLKAIARHSMEIYKSTNLRHRTDGLCPAFFSNPPTFNFKLFFDNIKTPQYEKDISATLV